jgi:hypothetical protein
MRHLTPVPSSANIDLEIGSADSKGGCEMRTRITAVLTAGLLLALVFAPGAAADRVYHSQHVALTPVGGAPLRSGFVENVHPDGPQVYAHEIYVLNGAVANASLEVHLLAYPFDPTCSGEPADFGFTSLDTDAVGNGSADRFITPADIPPQLRGATHGVRWEITSDGVVLYETGCNAVTLD